MAAESSNGSRFFCFLAGVFGPKLGGVMARRLCVDRRKQPSHGARGRPTKALVEMNDLDTLVADRGVSFCKLNIAGERFIDATGIARAESACRMPWQQYFYFAGLLLWNFWFQYFYFFSCHLR
jgi:hypothetical protein